MHKAPCFPLFSSPFYWRPFCLAPHHSDPPALSHQAEVSSVIAIKQTVHTTN